MGFHQYADALPLLVIGTLLAKFDFVYEVRNSRFLM